jgi:hypothetical protein
LNKYAEAHDNQILKFASADDEYKKNMNIHLAGFPYKQQGS